MLVLKQSLFLVCLKSDIVYAKIIFRYGVNMEEKIIKIKKSSEDFIAQLGFNGESIVVMDGKTIIVNYQVDDAAMLIGRGGEVLDALQHIMRMLLLKDFEDRDTDLVVDISGYREKKASQLTRKAKDKAYQVFPPMSSYERMIIHTACTNIADIETESQGSGRDRRVVIRPKKVK